MGAQSADGHARKAILEAARGAVGFVLGCSLALSLLQLALPLFTMQVFDRVLNSASLETLAFLSLLAFGCFLVLSLLEAIRGQVFSIVGHRFAAACTAPVLDAAFGLAARGGSGRPSQALRDVAELRGFVSGHTAELVPQLLVCPLFFLVLFALHPAYGLVAVGGGVILLVSSVAGQTAATPALDRANRQLVASSAEIGEGSQYAEAIEAMGMTGTLLRRWEGQQQHYLHLLDRAGRQARLLTGLNRLLRLSLQAGVMAVGAILVLQHAASPGSLFAASLIMGRALAPFEQVTEAWRAGVSAWGAWQRLGALLARQPVRGTERIEQPSGDLKVDRVTVIPAERDVPVLRNVSFAITPGEVLGVIGPSGAGKSTLARVIMGVTEPAGGGVFLDGINVRLWDRASLGRWIGYLPQDVGLLAGSVAQNIARMEQPDMAKVVEAARAAGVHEMVGRLPMGYQSHLGPGGVRLSGGQLQRIALARALYGEPRLLVLDEPNAHLDQSGEAALVQTVERAKQAGTAVLLITHRPAILAAADRIVVLRDGMVDQIGSRAEIFRRYAPPAEAAVPGASSPRLVPT